MAGSLSRRGLIILPLALAIKAFTLARSLGREWPKCFKPLVVNHALHCRCHAQCSRVPSRVSWRV